MQIKSCLAEDLSAPLPWLHLGYVGPYLAQHKFPLLSKPCMNQILFEESQNDWHKNDIQVIVIWNVVYFEFFGKKDYDNTYPSITQF